MRFTHTNTLTAMRRDRTLAMRDAYRIRVGSMAGDVRERVATARRINRAIVHYLRHVVAVQS